MGQCCGEELRICGDWIDCINTDGLLDSFQSCSVSSQCASGCCGQYKWCEAKNSNCIPDQTISSSTLLLILTMVFCFLATILVIIICCACRKLKQKEKQLKIKRLSEKSESKAETESQDPKRRKSFILDLFQQASIVIHEAKKATRSTSCKNLQVVTFNRK